jgi:hypothetical protein
MPRLAGLNTAPYNVIPYNGALAAAAAAVAAEALPDLAQLRIVVGALPGTFQRQFASAVQRGNQKRVE